MDITMPPRLLCVALFLGFSVPSVAMEKSRPNIILLESDDHHFEALGCMGDPVETPNLDRLTARGILFRNNVCQGTACAPSRNALLTGSYPHNTGVYHNQDGNMPAGIWTFPQALQQAGYSTAMIGKNHFKPPTEFTERINLKPYDLILEETRALGFDYLHSIAGKVSAASPSKANRADLDPYRNYLKDKGLLDELIQDYTEKRGNSRAEPTHASVLSEDDYQDTYIARQTIEWIEQYEEEKPFFAWVDFVAPHPPADAPEPYAGMYDWEEMRKPLPRPDDAGPPKGWLREADDELFQRFRAAYYAMITCLDAQIGEILDTLDEKGLTENTVIVFTGDQGSLLGDHGLWGKGSFYKGSINSPLIVAGPDSFRSGEEVTRPVELIDLAPTFLELADAPKDDIDRCEGQSLLPLLTGDGNYTRNAAFAEEYESKMIVNERWKFIRDPEGDKLFDMENDPEELSNLASRKVELTKRLDQRIDDWLEKSPPVREPNPR